MCDEVVVAEKTKSPVDETEEKKYAWDNLLFCNKYDRIYKLKLNIVTYNLEYWHEPQVMQLVAVWRLTGFGLTLVIIIHIVGLS